MTTNIRRDRSFRRSGWRCNVALRLTFLQQLESIHPAVATALFVSSARERKSMRCPVVPKSVVW